MVRNLLLIIGDYMLLKRIIETEDGKIRRDDLFIDLEPETFGYFKGMTIPFHQVPELIKELQKKLSEEGIL